jgi:dihydrofolate reductase
MRISLIAASSANGVIGADGTLPWHLPDDFRFFRQTTMGRPIIMGRRTFESIGRPLPGRRNIVLTRSRDYRADGAAVAGSADEALAAAAGADEVFVIGGGEIYALFLDRASRVYLTRVDAQIEGDTRFPELDPDDWQLTSVDAHAPDERHAWGFEFRVYDRR